MCRLRWTTKECELVLLLFELAAIDAVGVEAKVANDSAMTVVFRRLNFWTLTSRCKSVSFFRSRVIGRLSWISTEPCRSRVAMLVVVEVLEREKVAISMCVLFQTDTSFDCKDDWE
jgi:hypothetical protein